MLQIRAQILISQQLKSFYFIQFNFLRMQFKAGMMANKNFIWPDLNIIIHYNQENVQKTELKVGLDMEIKKLDLMSLKL